MVLALTHIALRFIEHFKHFIDCSENHVLTQLSRCVAMMAGLGEG